MVEKSDKFDKWMLNCQNFPLASYRNFALKKFPVSHILRLYNLATINTMNLLT